MSNQINEVVVCDALDYLRGFEDGTADAIITDPPYNGVKQDAWDNQWPTDGEFVAWMRTFFIEFRRVLKPNGSIYVFASPRLASRIEVALMDYFNVLNRITWRKPAFSTKAEMFDKDTMRAFFPASEAIIFAEQYNADGQYQNAVITAGETYQEALSRVKVGVFGDYLTSEFDKAKVTRREIAALFPSVTGGLTGCVSNWTLGYNIPTKEQYEKMRKYLNRNGGAFLTSEYTYLCREYESLRREYESLRREYESLRRPFNASPYRPYTDVWDFKTVQSYEGKHPCEKPMALMKHIVESSTRPNDLVLDPFAGSGTTLRAAQLLGRRYAGCDLSPQYVEIARRRLAEPYTPSLFPDEPTATEPDAVQLGMFGEGE